MPEQLSSYIEKGFFGLASLMASATLAAIGMHAKQDRDFRAQIHKKIDKNARHVDENHPTKDEFKIAFNSLEKQMSSIQNDVREIRAKL